MEPAPEGTWSSSQVGYVSREALVEAEAVPQVRERVTWQQWAKRGAATVVVLGVAAMFALWVINYRSRNRETAALAKALEYVDAGNKLNPVASAEVQRLAGSYFLRAGRLEDARNRWHEARKAIREAKDAPPLEKDLALIDLAKTQLDAGGSKEEAIAGLRLKWDQAINDVRQTLESVQTPEARVDGVRDIARLLIQLGQDAYVRPLASQLSEQSPEILAIAGLELLQAKQSRVAEDLVRLASDKLAKQQPGPKPSVPPGAKPPPDPPAPKPATVAAPPAVITLWVGLGKADEANRLTTAAPPKDESIVRIALVEGAARHGDWAQAEAATKSTATPQERLQMLLALAAVHLDEGQSEPARQNISEAIGLVDAGVIRDTSPWAFSQLVRLGARAGAPPDGLAKIAKLVQDPALRGWSQLALLRNQLQSTPTPDGNDLAQTVDKGTPAYGVGLEEVTRLRVRMGATDAAQSVASWDPESLRAFGYMGIALGVQDRRQ
jgi:tetratricopeptide (TPR) repeat protein